MRLDENISDNLFNQKYLPKINNYITLKINSLNTIEKNIYNLYSQVYRLPHINSNYDYYFPPKNSCISLQFLVFWVLVIYMELVVIGTFKVIILMLQIII